MELGLRIDVDTYRGTKIGVPNLVKLLEKFGIKATIFFSVGPDNMGRNIKRLCKPVFLLKMLRSGAPSLYGWDIVLRGTLGPGPIIGERLGSVIKLASETGHEVGLHAWDHYTWQTRIDTMDCNEIYKSLEQGVQLLEEVTGSNVLCSAAPAWKVTSETLVVKQRFPFSYNSDCRGHCIFYPVVNGKVLDQAQIPVTMPTYDEVIGRCGITDENYNDYIMSWLSPHGINVLTVHAEVEGVKKLRLFEQFLRKVQQFGVKVVPLGELLRRASLIPVARVIKKGIDGREGWVSCQAPTRT